MGALRDFAVSWARARRDDLERRLQQHAHDAARTRVPFGAPRLVKGSHRVAKIISALAPEHHARKTTAAAAAATARAVAQKRRAASGTASGGAAAAASGAGRGGAADAGLAFVASGDGGKGEDEPLYASQLARWLRPLVIGAVGFSGRAWLTVFNRFEAHGTEHLLRALHERPAGTPLMTVSNHVAALDDPFIPSTLVPAERLLTADRMRWTLCAAENCFRTDFTRCFFAAGKAVPVERGAGADQAGMREMRDRLADGEWVHIFPEGTRSRDGGATLTRAKRGVGWLADAAERKGGVAPLIVPYVHDGMQHVQPRRTKVPRVGNTVRVLMGEPIDVSDLFEERRERERAAARASEAARAGMSRAGTQRSGLGEGGDDGATAAAAALSAEAMRAADLALQDAIATRCDAAMRVLHERLHSGLEAEAGASAWRTAVPEGVWERTLPYQSGAAAWAGAAAAAPARTQSHAQQRRRLVQWQWQQDIKHLVQRQSMHLDNYAESPWTHARSLLAWGAPTPFAATALSMGGAHARPRLSLWRALLEEGVLPEGGRTLASLLDAPGATDAGATIALAPPSAAM